MTWTVHPHKHKLTAPHHDVFISVDGHDGVFFMPPPTPPVFGKAQIHIGAGYMGMCAISGSPKKNSNEHTVLADGVYLASRDAEVTRLILPHINVGPPFNITPNPNLLIPLLILGSSTKHMWAVGSVKGPGGSVASTFVPSFGLPVGVGYNQSCNDPCAIPTSMVLMHGSVFVGMTLADYYIGLFYVLLDSGIEFALGKLMEKTGDKLGKWLKNKLGGQKYLRSQMNKFLKKTMNPWFRPLSRNILGGEASFIAAYSKKGTKNFQSLGDKYVGAAMAEVGKLVGLPTSDKGAAGTALKLTGLDSGGLAKGVSNWVMGSAEAF
jgi:hypothetical protein